ncbi:MAG: 30S ribosomal protein S5 [Halobacteriota archaeon]
MAERIEGWTPRTRLGHLVYEGKITTFDDAVSTGFPVKEPEIIDMLLPDLSDEVLDINMVQRMTDSGRRVKFRAAVAIGNRDGYIGFAEGKDLQAGPAIRKAIETAKLNLIKINRGCGSWECGCGEAHTVPYTVEGKAGSVSVALKPAPRGLGIASGSTARKVLELAGIKDVWTRSSGQTRTTINFARATFEALKGTTTVRIGGGTQ